MKPCRVEDRARGFGSTSGATTAAAARASAPGNDVSEVLFFGLRAYPEEEVVRVELSAEARPASAEGGA